MSNKRTKRAEWDEPAPASSSWDIPAPRSWDIPPLEAQGHWDVATWKIINPLDFITRPTEQFKQQPL